MIIQAFIFANIISTPILISMKKLTFFFLLFLISYHCISQTRKSIDSFLDIKLGSNAKTVKAGVAANGGRFLKDSSNTSTLVFDQVKLGNRDGLTLIVRFVKGKAFLAIFAFPNAPNECIQYYQGLVKELNGIYGQGEPYKNFTGTYHEGDGKELEAINSGHAQYLTTWTSANSNAIQARIEQLQLVSLMIQDTALQETLEKN